MELKRWWWGRLVRQVSPNHCQPCAETPTMTEQYCLFWVTVKNCLNVMLAWVTCSVIPLYWEDRECRWNSLYKENVTVILVSWTLEGIQPRCYLFCWPLLSSTSVVVTHWWPTFTYLNMELNTTREWSTTPSPGLSPTRCPTTMISRPVRSSFTNSRYVHIVGESFGTSSDISRLYRIPWWNSTQRKRSVSWRLLQKTFIRKMRLSTPTLWGDSQWLPSFPFSLYPYF